MGRGGEGRVSAGEGGEGRVGGREGMSGWEEMVKKVFCL